jgi:hypothetical protein
MSPLSFAGEGTFIWSWPTLFREVRFAISNIFLSSNTYLLVSHHFVLLPEENISEIRNALTDEKKRHALSYAITCLTHTFM